MKEFAKKVYKSTQWRKVRQLVIDRANGWSEPELKQGKYVPGYIVDHIIPLTPDNVDNQAIAFGLDNLQYVSKEWHDNKHLPSHLQAGEFKKAEPTIEKDLYFDENGMILERPIDR